MYLYVPILLHGLILRHRITISEGALEVTQWQGRTIGTRFGAVSAQEMLNIEVSIYSR
jgi:hypothetical protein